MGYAIKPTLMFTTFSAARLYCPRHIQYYIHIRTIYVLFFVFSLFFFHVAFNWNFLKLYVYVYSPLSGVYYTLLML